jgi:hypothetical protein
MVEYFVKVSEKNSYHIQGEVSYSQFHNNTQKLRKRERNHVSNPAAIDALGFALSSFTS